MFNELTTIRKRHISGPDTLDRQCISHKNATLRAAASGLALLAAAPAAAQSPAPATISEDERNDVERFTADEIIVTGSNIRGVGAPAAPTVVIDAADIDAGGFATLSDVFNALPQNTPTIRPGIPVGGGTVPLATAGGAGVNLRGLGAGSTLVLLNGKRLAPAGRGDFFDISLIPAAAIDRVETVLDGGSPIYGTDAVAGTVNVILKDDYEGAETRVRYGTAFDGDGEEVRVGQIIGKNWSSGNITASYEFLTQDPIALSDRNFLSRDPEPIGNLGPDLDRHSAFVSLRQDILANLTFEAEALASFRDQSDSFPAGLTIFGADDSNADQFSFSSALNWDVGSDWLVALSGTRSSVSAEQNRENFAIINGGLSAAPLSQSLSSTDNRFTVITAVADGPLFTLPGGTVKAAVGGEFRRQFFDAESSNGEAFSPTIDRNVWAGFAELAVPLVSPDMAVPGVYSLDLSVAGRYERYSDFGGTANPRVGVEWRPIEDLTIKGSFGTSFRAPDFATQFVGGNFGQLADVAPFLSPTLNIDSLPILLISGQPNLNELEPERARTFSVGFDYSPAYIEGFNLSVSYFDIEFEDRIAAPGLFPNIIETELTEPNQFPDSVIVLNPSLTFLEDVVDTLTLPPFQFPGQMLTLEDVAAFVDGTERNLAEQRVNGLDALMNYQKETNLGTFTTSLNLSFQFANEQSLVPGAEPIDVFNRVFFPTDFRARGQIGWSDYGLNVNAFVNYSDGFPNDFAPSGGRVGSFTTVDANIAYDFSELAGDSGPLAGLLLRVSLNNLLDEEPPLIFQSPDEASFGLDFDTVNADAFGRRIAVELVKRW